jgi:beta-lactamase class A
MNTALIALVLAALAVSAAAQTIDQNVTAKLASIAKSYKTGKVGFYAHNLRTNAIARVNADDPSPTASTIKLLILAEAMHEIHDGKKSLDDEITLTKDDQVFGSGVLMFFRTPMKLTFEDVLAMMVIQSDNTATNLAIEHLGRDKINQRAELMGLKNTYLYKKVYRPVEGTVPADQKKFGLGKTTAAEMGKIMESIARCEVKDEALCEKVYGWLKNQSYRNMIPKYIEPNVDWTEGGSKIGDKIGQINESRSDVAIVWTDQGTIVISAYTYDNKDQRWNSENEGEKVIADMAKIVHDAWAKPAKAPARVK